MTDPEAWNAGQPIAEAAGLGKEKREKNEVKQRYSRELKTFTLDDGNRCGHGLLDIEMGRVNDNSISRG